MGATFFNSRRRGIYHIDGCIDHRLKQGHQQRAIAHGCDAAPPLSVADAPPALFATPKQNMGEYELLYSLKELDLNGEERRATADSQ